MTPHSSSIRVSYGVSFVDPASDWYSVSVPVIIYVVFYNIGPNYNDTWLYFEDWAPVDVVYRSSIF